VDDGVLYVLLALIAIGVVVTAVQAIRIRRFLAQAVRVPGKVVNVVPENHEFGGSHGQSAETVVYYANFVEFPMPDGSVVKFRSRVEHPRNPIYARGQTVTVVYEPGSPTATAEIEGPAVWRPAIFTALATVVLVLFTLGAKACN